MRNKYILGLISGLSVLPLVGLAQIAGNLKPKIETFNTATSTKTIITAPPGYQSSVVSTYDGREFHTVATSTPLTSADIKKMQDDMLAQQEAMNNMFRAQQAFFDEQNKMFENMMGITFPDLAPAKSAPKKEATSVVKKSIPPVTPPHIVATSSAPMAATSSVPEPVVEIKQSFFQKILRFFGL